MSATLSSFSFDPSLSFGNVLTILAAAGGALMAFFRVKGKLDVQNVVLEGIQKELVALRDIQVGYGRIDERLVAMQREITELKHGKGFVKNGTNGN